MNILWKPSATELTNLASRNRKLFRKETTELLIQLPGIKDPERAKNLIGKTALLEFKIVDEENSLEEALRGNIPEGDIIAYGLRDG